MAPPSPKARLRSLPPILRIQDPPPVPSCSKAPRGLFVLARETRIFTGTSISPSPSLRQRSDRYAIRAGRNLPDKEFRYLRQLCCHPIPKRAGRAGHFCRPLHVAMQVGPSLLAPFRGRVRRMVSEDSGQSPEATVVEARSPGGASTPVPSRSFLLIVRTGRIVSRLRRLAPDPPEFPAYSQIL